MISVEIYQQICESRQRADAIYDSWRNDLRKRNDKKTIDDFICGVMRDFLENFRWEEYVKKGDVWRAEEHPSLGGNVRIAVNQFDRSSSMDRLTDKLGFDKLSQDLEEAGFYPHGTDGRGLNSFKIFELLEDELGWSYGDFCRLAEEITGELITTGAFPVKAAEPKPTGKYQVSESFSRYSHKNGESVGVDGGEWWPDLVDSLDDAHQQFRVAQANGSYSNDDPTEFDGMHIDLDDSEVEVTLSLWEVDGEGEILDDDRPSLEGTYVWDLRPSIYESWRGDLPERTDIEDCVREAMRDFVLKELDRFVGKGNPNSWDTLVGNDAHVKGVVDVFLEDSHAVLKHPGNNLGFNNLIHALDKAGFSEPTPAFLLKEQLGYDDDSLTQIAKELVLEHFKAGELPLAHMQGKGEHTWTLCDVEQVQGDWADDDYYPPVTELTYKMTDTTTASAAHHKTYFLDVRPAKGDKSGEEGLIFGLRDDTGKWYERLTLPHDELTDEVFLDVEKEIEDGELGSAHKHSKTD